MKISINTGLLTFILLGLVCVEPTFAGPGGKIVSAVFDSFWGKIAFAVLTVIFLPLILWLTIKEKLAEKRSRNDLRFMAAHSPSFEWLKIQQRATDCFYQIHSSWSKQDLSDASQWMTSWYWKNQQLVQLENWQKTD